MRFFVYKNVKASINVELLKIKDFLENKSYLELLTVYN